MLFFPSKWRPLARLNTAQTVALWYVLVVTLWVVFSDQMLARVEMDPVYLLILVQSKKFLLITLTGVLLWYLMQVYMERLETSERRLRESEAAYRHLFESNAAPGWIFDEDTLRILAVNKAAMKQYGYDEETFLTFTIRDLRPPDAQAELDQALAAIPRGDQFKSGIFRHWNSRQEVFYVEIQTDAVQFMGYRARLVRAADVTERVVSQRQLARLLERLDEATRIARLGYWEYDAQTGEMHWSDELKRMLHLPVIEGPNRLGDFLALVRADQVERVREMFEAGEPFDAEICVRLPTMSWCYLSVRGRLEDSVSRLRMRGTMMDITARKDAELKQEEADNLYRELIALLPDAVLLIKHNSIIFASQAASQVFGGEPEQMVGRSFYEFVAVEHIEWARELLARFEDPRCRETNVPSQPLLNTLGQRFDAEIAARAISVAGECAVLMVVRCITQRLEIKRSLQLANQRLTSLSTQVLELLEGERQMISRELHDDIGQALTAMDLSLGWVQKRVDAAPVQERLDLIGSMIKESLSKVRNLSLMLRPPQLDALGLAAALEWQAERVLKGAEIRCVVDTDGLVQEPAKDVAQIAFRIAQECLTNILRHAGASHVLIRLSSDEQRLCLEILDDGCGFDVAAVERETLSVGILSMRERAAMVGGHLNISSRNRVGTHVNVTLPLQRKLG